jgi:hypothetical protein
MFMDKPTLRGRKYPSLQSFAPSSVSETRGVSRLAEPWLHPKGEEIRRGESRLQVALMGREGPIYVSAKRTHFIFVFSSMYHIYLQIFMPFAAAFANGFVHGKRTHFAAYFLEGKRANGESPLG